MKKLALLMVSVLALVGLYLTATPTNAQPATDTKYQLDVTGGNVTFNVFSGTLDIGDFTVSSTTGTYTTTNDTYTANSFVLEDLDATNDTWIITMDTSDLVGVNPANTIADEQIYVNGSAVNTAAGPASCSTDVTAVTASWNQFNGSTVTLFDRNTVTNGSTCRVGTTLSIGVSTPAYQAVDVYTATITVTATAGSTVTPSYAPSLTY